MRNQKVLINVLKKFVEVVFEECNRNPDFAVQIDQIITEISPAIKKTSKTKSVEVGATNIPDLYGEWHNREEVDFSLWLVEHSLPVLHAIVRSYELDARKQSSKWKDPKKMTDFIIEKLRSKVLRGSSFIRTNESSNREDGDIK